MVPAHLKWRWEGGGGGGGVVRKKDAQFAEIHQVRYFAHRRLFLNSWRVSIVPYYVTTHPPAIQKQHWHSRDAQIECEL